MIKENGIVSPAFILKQIKMSPDGLRSLLQRLVDRKLIRAIGKNRGRKYLVVTP
jgi:predicted HTH transcriptional regulator